MEIKRDLYLEKLCSRRRNGMIKVVTGIRRCGKSYLLFTIFKNRLLSEGVDPRDIIEIKLEEMEAVSLRNPVALYPTSNTKSELHWTEAAFDPISDGYRR